MVVPILKGGLGNQMFQIANAYAYAKRNAFDFGINYDLSFCPNQGHVASKYKNNIYKNIPITNIKPNKVYSEIDFKFQEIPNGIDNVLFDGYFQSDKYFIDFEEDVRNLFTFLSEVEVVKDFVQKFKNLVGIHIRRGDYLKFKDYHGIQSSNYYIKASKIIGECNAIICTDDWNTLKNEMSFKKAIKSPFDDEILDLYLLSQCDSLVICNSSFSWWGAFLGKKKDKVIAPKNWFNEKGHKEFNDVYRKGWIII
jgi:hypothetical protein